MATKKKQLPPWLADKQKKDGSSDGRGKQSSTTAPSKGTAADKRKSDNGTTSKKPGPKPGTAAAKRGSAAGGRKSRKK